MDIANIEQNGVISRDDFDRLVLTEGLLPSEAVEMEQKLDVESFKVDTDDERDRRKPLTSLGLYKKEISKIPQLTPEEERDLSYLVHNSPDEYTRIQARNKLVEHNLAFGYWMAKKFYYRASGSFGFEDIIQECNQGLIKAAECYDGSKGVKFCSYAYYTVLSAVNRAITETAYSVKIPQSYPAKFNNLKLAQNEAVELYGEGAPIEEIVRIYHRMFPGNHITVQAAEEVLSLFPSAISLESPMYVGDDNEALTFERRRESVADTNPLASELVEEKVRIDELKDLIDVVLNDREKEILLARFDIENESEPVAFRVIGEKFGISPQRAGDILKKSIEKLERAMERTGFREMITDRQVY